MKTPSRLDTVRRLLSAGRSAEACRLLKQAPERGQDKGEFWYLLGVADHLQGRQEEARHALQRAVNLLPDSAAPLVALGTVLGQHGRHEAARDCFLRALELAPGDPSLLTSLGVACEALGRDQEALEHYDRALAADPHWRDARLNRARLRLARGRARAAREDYDHLLARDPEDVEARFSRAEAGLVAGDFEAVIEDCRLLLQREPAHGGALLDLGVAMAALGRLEGAQAIFDRLRADPPAALAGWRLPGEAAPLALEWLDARALFLLQAWKRLQRADWRDREQLAEMVRQAAREEPVPALCEPAVAFPLLSLPLEPQTLRVWLRRVSQTLESGSGAQGFSHPVRACSEQRIHLGYLSAHFGRHPSALNLGCLFGEHDRERFEVTGISIGPDDGSSWYRRIAEECDNFEEFQNLDTDSAAERIRDLGIDLLIDLNGYTSGALPALLARRPAPIQISYLGFCAPIPAAFYDYDITCHAAEPLPWQGEPTCPVFLPHNHFLFDDRNRPGKTPARSSLGLPDGALVFCCFNNTYKIEPLVFSLWMQLLQVVPDSVLWLLERSPEASHRLRQEAVKQGIEPARLVFAPYVEVEAHLARYPLADLFLDTFCYNAHTTAQEALYSGLPVLTCPGRTRAARIGASLVLAAGLPEMVCRSPQEYLDRAIALGRDPAARQALKWKLLHNRKSAPLFDVSSRIRDLERAYALAWQRYQAGQPAIPIDLSAGRSGTAGSAPG